MAENQHYVDRQKSLVDYNSDDSKYMSSEGEDPEVLEEDLDESIESTIGLREGNNTQTPKESKLIILKNSYVSDHPNQRCRENCKI